MISVSAYENPGNEDPLVSLVLIVEGKGGNILCPIYTADVPNPQLAHFLYGLLGEQYDNEFQVRDEGFGHAYFQMGVKAAMLLFSEAGNMEVAPVKIPRS